MIGDLAGRNLAGAVGRQVGGKGERGGCEKQVMLLRGFDREFGGRKFGREKKMKRG